MKIGLKEKFCNLESLLEEGGLEGTIKCIGRSRPSNTKTFSKNIILDKLSLSSLEKFNIIIIFNNK